MRKFIVAAAMAIGLVALWAVILPLTAQPASKQTNVAPSTVTEALFLCRGPNGIDRTCAAALAKALVLEASDTKPANVNDRICRADPQALAKLASRD
jgi:hypothetical protein